MGKSQSEPQNKIQLHEHISEQERQANALMTFDVVTQDIQATMLGKGLPLGGEVVVCLDGEQDDDFEDRVAAALRPMR